MPRLPRTARLVLSATLALAATAQADGLRVVTWNVSNYSGGRAAAFDTAVYGVFEGRSMSPDVFLLQEMLSDSSVQQLVQILNAAPDSPGDWAAAPFVDGNDTDNGFLYRTSKVELLGSVVVAQGGASPNHPRDINRYDVRLVGYGSVEGVISLYSTHMKASTGGSNEARRLLEAQRIRADAEALPDGQHFILGGDFNIRSSNEGAYQELIIVRDDGRFVDPIASPGSWNNSSTFRYIHTQDPIGAGGVDDRYDQLLVSASLVDGDGADYLGQAAIPYSRSTWDDPNHSYRCWGNDGSSYNTVLRSEGNEMVGADIADALKLICNGSGHLPVMLDLVVPARLGADAVIDFGTVTVGAVATELLTAGNAGDTVLWGPDGIGVLEYALGVEAPFGAPGGIQHDGAGGAFNVHEITLDTSTAGVYEAVLVIASNDPEVPLFEVLVRGEVVGCVSDWNADGSVDTLDFLAYLNDWVAGDLIADLTGDGTVDTQDFLEFLNLWAEGC